MSLTNHVDYEKLGPWDVHFDYVRSFVFFDDPHYKFVSASDDKSVIIWDSKTNTRIKKITDHRGYIFHTIKWDSDTFLTSSWDLTVLSYCIKPPFRQIKRFDFFKGDIMQILKVNDDLILSCDTCSITLISYSRCEIIKTLKSQKIRLLKNLRLSKIQPHSFFVNVDDLQKNLNLIDFEQDITLRKFRNAHKNHLLTFRTFLKKEKQEEHVVCAGYEGKIYVYINKFIKRSDISANMECMKETRAVKMFVVNEDKCLYSMELIRMKYLMIGDTSGHLYIYNIFEDYEVLAKIPVFEHNDSMRSLGVKKISGSSGIALCAGSDSGKVCVVRIKSGLCVPDLEMEKFEKEDLQERMNFLINERESYWFNEEEKERMFLRIKMKNSVLEYIFRILL